MKNFSDKTVRLFKPKYSTYDEEDRWEMLTLENYAEIYAIMYGMENTFNGINVPENSIYKNGFPQRTVLRISSYTILEKPLPIFDFWKRISSKFHFFFFFF
jgi:hypothetical protein